MIYDAKDARSSHDSTYQSRILGTMPNHILLFSRTDQVQINLAIMGSLLGLTKLSSRIRGIYTRCIQDASHRISGGF